MNRSANFSSIQRRVKHHSQDLDAYSFFNLLTSPELLELVEDLSPSFRERLFPPTETLSMFLSQALSADRSCRNIVNASAVQRLAAGLPAHGASTGSYCKARQRLPVKMLSEVARYTGKLIAEQIPAEWHWQGRPVKLVDGTTVTMPDTVPNQEKYPQQGSQKPGLGFPICRIVALVCLASGSVMNAAIGRYKGKGGDEQSLLRGMLDTFVSGDVVVGDAYYATYFLLTELHSRGVDGVFEQHGMRRRSTDFRKGKKLGKNDHQVIYHKPRIKPDWMSADDYDAAPATITVRELKVDNRILVTTLLSIHQASRQSLKKLYKERWHVELDLRSIKTTLGMETFSCKTPEMVEKEMWTYMLAYNLVRMVMAQSALLADIMPRTISFKHSLQIWRSYRSNLVVGPIDLDELFALIASITVGNRPGRVEPRAVKRRPRPFPLLMKRRNLAREEIMKNGHPKKQR